MMKVWTIRAGIVLMFVASPSCCNVATCNQHRGLLRGRGVGVGEDLNYGNGAEQKKWRRRSKRKRA
jgi:hypothetical protein